MLKAILGKKIGMSQIFDETGKVVPVTVVDLNNWYVTQVKTDEVDGYSALQLGLLKKRYRTKPFQKDWIKNKKKYFSTLREVVVDGSSLKDYSVAMPLAGSRFEVKIGDLVSVTGVSKGLGFQGVMKRWNFHGGPGAHGSDFHRIPGSLGGKCAAGRVAKGKKLPGHTGFKRITIKGLEVVKVDGDSGYLFIKGCVPGKKDSLLFVRKQG